MNKTVKLFIIMIITVLIIAIGILIFYELSIHESYTATIIEIKQNTITMAYNSKREVIDEKSFNILNNLHGSNYIESIAQKMSKKVYQFNINNAIIQDMDGKNISASHLKEGDTIFVIDKRNYAIPDVANFINVDGISYMITNLRNVIFIKVTNNNSPETVL